MTCEVEAAEDMVVYGDADKLARVFDNILRNAVSYCYPNTKIRIQAEMTEEGNRIVFSNRGKQIPKEQLGTIFESFIVWMRRDIVRPEVQDLDLPLQRKLWNCIMERSVRRVTSGKHGLS